METGMIVIATILLLICSLPIILIKANLRKRDKQLKNGIEVAISNHGGTLTEYETDTNFALGIDRTAKHVYFYKKTSELAYFQEVNLNEAVRCEVKKETRRLKKEKTFNDVVIKIALMFISKKGDVMSQFELYNEDDSFQLNGELQFANTWQKKVSDLISENASPIKESEHQKTAPAFS